LLYHTLYDFESNIVIITSTVTTITIGVVLALTILYTVRRDQLHGPFALWWLVVAGLAIVLPLFPHLLDRLARSLGIVYPPTLFLLLAISLILVKMLSMDLQRTRQEKKIRRLTQRLAILEHELKQLTEQDQAGPVSAEPDEKGTKQAAQNPATEDTPRLGKAG